MTTTNPRILIKLGGTLLDDQATRDRLAEEIREASRRSRAVVVHGGGKQMTRFLAERGVESRFINGLRVTTPEVIDAVLKVFAGTVNHQLVASLVRAGSQAVGISGVDSALVECEPLGGEYGAVGKPVRCNPGLLETLTESGFTPVVACIGGDQQGNIFNVNADQMAVSCAVGFRAESLLFLTDVEGVRDQDGNNCPQLNVQQMRQLIQGGVATGGMQAKLEAAILALVNGVQQVIIAPGARPGVISELLGGKAVGTKLIQDRPE
jgi:acetylglutamate kinase